MKKISFAFVAVILTTVLFSCQPAKQGGEQYTSPSRSIGGSDQPVIGKVDSSVEKAVQAKNLEDSVLNGKR